MAEHRFMSLEDEGPVQYTSGVLEVMRELSTDPDEKAGIDRQLLLLRARQFEQYKNVPRSMGIINTKEDAMLALSDYFGGRIGRLDAKISAGGKEAYRKYVNAAFGSLAKKLDYQGKWDVLVEVLVRRASAYWHW